MLDFLKCQICFNTYNESAKRPRTLYCGHTFCESCLSATIENVTLTCPRCRKVHNTVSASDLTVNFDLEGILKSLNLSSQSDSEDDISRTINEDSEKSNEGKVVGSLKSLLDQQERSLSAQKELLKTSAGLCHDHPSCELKFRCSLHKCWVCEKCIAEHGDHPNKRCKVVSFKEEIEERKQEHKKHLENEGNSLDETLSSIETHISDLNTDRVSRVELIKLLQDLTKLHVKEEKKLENEILSFENMLFEGKQIKQSLLDVDSHVDTCESLDESNLSRDKVYSKKEEVKDWKNLSERKINKGKVVLEEAVYSLMASSMALEYRSNITETSEAKYGLLLQNIKNLEANELGPLLQNFEEIGHGPIKISANKIKLNDIQFMMKNLNRTINFYKDDLIDVTRAMDQSWNCEEITTKVQLILLSLLGKVFKIHDLKTNAFAVQSLHDSDVVRAGQITRSNGRIVVYSMELYATIPYRAIIIPFEPLLQLYSSNSSVFLCMNEGLNYKGTVDIKIYEGASRGKAMLSHCTGHHGWSYKSSLLLCNTDERWRSFVQSVNVNPFPPSLKVIHDRQPNHSNEEGSITPAYRLKEPYGAFNDATFGVILVPNSKDGESFGKIINGLSVIKDIDTKKGVCITDCGIII